MTQDPYLTHRRLLFGTAYRMLGTVSDAEDVLQDTWLAWQGVQRDTVANPRAYLVRMVTNLSLNRLTSARATRETYVGPWLPEPLLDTYGARRPTGLGAAEAPGSSRTSPDPAAETEMAETVSTAMLVVLETLSPVERAVFVLREVFGYSHAEIAETLSRPEATVRQIAHRAREHVQARRPRYDTDEARRAEITERFLAACDGGDLNAAMQMLAPDVVAWCDGGGKVTAARRPLYGPDHVARWLLGVLRKPVSAGVRMEPATINGELGILFTIEDMPIGTLTYEVDGEVLRDLRFQFNPDKLRGLGTEGDGSEGA